MHPLTYPPKQQLSQPLNQHLEQDETQQSPASQTVTVFSPLKVNLYLHVLSKRSDGYHDLESLAVFGDYADSLAWTESDHYSLKLDQAKKLPPGFEVDNLITKTVRLFEAAFDIQVKHQVQLTKNIPISAGLGGGSSNAAATLKALLQLYAGQILGFDEQEKQRKITEISNQLGSDVPACYAAQPLYILERGDVIKQTKLPFAFYLLLVNPGVAVSTPAVFKGLDIPPEQKRDSAELPLAFKNYDELLAFLKERRNDLLLPALKEAPIIGDILQKIEALKGCDLTRLSGSGATCFGMFSKAKQAIAAGLDLQKIYPNFWIEVTTITAPLQPQK